MTFAKILVSLILFFSFSSPALALTYATWNPADKSSNATLTNGNLTTTRAAGGNDEANTRATIGKSSGKWYWEIEITNQIGELEQGVGDSSAVIDTSGLFAGDSHGWSYYGNSGGLKRHASTAAYGSNYVTNDIISVLLDMDAGTLTFWKNGSGLGQAYSGLSGTIYPMAFAYVATEAVTANFGANTFAYTPPDGYCLGLTDTCVSAEEGGGIGNLSGSDELGAIYYSTLQYFLFMIAMGSVVGIIYVLIFSWGRW